MRQQPQGLFHMLGRLGPRQSLADLCGMCVCIFRGQHLSCSARKEQDQAIGTVYIDVSALSICAVCVAGNLYTVYTFALSVCACWEQTQPHKWLDTRAQSCCASSLRDFATLIRYVYCSTGNSFHADPSSVTQVFSETWLNRTKLFILWKCSAFTNTLLRDSNVDIFLDEYSVTFIHLLTPSLSLLQQFVYHLKTVSVIIFPQDIHNCVKQLRAKN